MAEQLEAILSEGLNALSLPCPDDTLRRFRLFYTLLSERSQQMNLTAISGEEETARIQSTGSYRAGDGQGLLTQALG